MSKDDSNNNAKQGEAELEDAWRIRPCSIYEDEYRDCTALKSRFHQYFVKGESTDCRQWKRDLDNCYKWEEGNIKAGKEIIASEANRFADRLKAHYNNDVWEKRDKPPEDWNKPLPEYLQKQYVNSYLDIKNRETKGEIEPTIDSKCCIM